MKIKTIILLAASCSTVLAEPVTVDGIPFEKFVDIQKPVGIAFDAQDNLYVGNGSSGTGSDPIRFVPADGSAVISLNPSIVDPDFVVVDTEGTIAGQGSVLVGGSPLVALDPSTGTTTTVLDGVGNIFELHIDDQGTLFVGQYTGVAEVLKVTGGTAETIITIANAGSPRFTFESPDSLLVLTNEDFTVRRYDLNDLNAPTVLGKYDELIELGDLKYVDHGNFADTLFLTTVSSVYTLDQVTGEAELFASGFDHAVAISFDARGKMFVSSEEQNAIYTLVPEPSGMLLTLTSLVLLSCRRRAVAIASPS